MKNCPNCGAQIKEDAKFCRYCGKKLMQKQRPAPPAPEPPTPQSRETARPVETPPPAQAASVWEAPRKPETPKAPETPPAAREAAPSPETTKVPESPKVPETPSPVWEPASIPETPPAAQETAPIPETPKGSETPRPPQTAAPIREGAKSSETPRPETPRPLRENRQTPAGGDAVRFCPSCSSPLGKGDSFCTVCGRAVPKGPTPAAPPQARRGPKAWVIGVAAAVCVVVLGALAYFLLADGGPLPWRGQETQSLEGQLEADETRKPAEETAGQTDARQPEPEADADGQTVTDFAQSAGQDEAEPDTTPDTPEETPEPVEETPEPWSKAEEIDFDHLTELVEAQAPNATWAYCVLDLESGLGYGTLNATEALSASAMVIVPILYTLAAQMADGQLEMDTMVPITQNLGGRTQLSQRVGSSLSVEELARYMLQYSDNIATNTLLEYLGFENVEAVCAANGYASVSLANYVMATEDNTANDNYVSCADLCAMLFELYYNENSAIDGAFLEQYMHLQDDTEALGLLAQAPASLDTMNLNGQKTGKYNEVALVRDGESVYAMAFLGHGDKLEALQCAAKEVGQYCVETLELGE